MSNASERGAARRRRRARARASRQTHAQAQVRLGPSPATRLCGWLAAALVGSAATAAFAAAPANPAPSAPEGANATAASGADGDSVVDRFIGEVARFRAYPQFDRAYALVRAGRDKEALSSFEAGLRHEPGNTAARLAWVDALTRLGRRDQALRQTSQALQLAPNHPGALRRRALLLLESGRRAEAASDLRTLLALPSASEEDRRVAQSLLASAVPAPTTTVAEGGQGPAGAADRLVLEAPAWMEWVRTAEAHESQGRLRDALADYRRATALTADAGTKLNLLGAQVRLARQIGDVQSLRACLLQAHELAPNNVTVLRDLVALAQRGGDRAEVRGWMAKLAAASRSAADLEYVANLHYAAGEAGAAAEQFRHAIARTREPVARQRLFMSLGHALMALDEPAQAAAAFLDAAALRPSTDALRAAAQAQHRGGDRAGAIATLRTLVRAQPGPANRLRLAAVLGEDEQDAEAVEQARLAAASATDIPTRLQAQRRLSLLHAHQGDLAALRSALTEVVKLAPDDSRARLTLAQTCADLGDLAAAEVQFELSVRQRPTLQGHRGLVAARTRLGDVPGSVAAYRGLLAEPGLEADEAARAQSALADLLMLQGDAAGAARSYRAALAGGFDQPAVRLGLGYALAGQQRSSEALAEFKTAYMAQPSAALALQLARTHAALGETEPALLYGEAALADAATLTAGQHKVLLRELATLNASQGRTAEAARLWERALALTPDAPTALELARALLADRQPDKALRSLSAWPADDPSSLLAADQFDLRSQVETLEKHPVQAREWLARAQQIDPMPDRRYRLALLDIELGRSDAGVRALEQLMQSDPQGRYREVAARALYGRRQFGAAAALYADAVKAEPDSIELRRAHAYALMRDGQNSAASDAFGDAVTLALRDGDAHELDVWRMRQEVRKLNKTVDFSAYESYRSRTADGRSAGAGAAQGSGVIPSQGGIEVAWRPPEIGLVDDRTLHLFGRVMWSHRPESLAIDRPGTQGSVGVRYKPLASQQFYLSAERLLKIGSATRGEGLLRASYGWTDGLDIADPRATNWNYTSLYADVGRLLGQHINVAYVEARQGWTWRVGEWLLLSPHAVFDGRWQRPDVDRSAYTEAGVGISLRRLFNAGALSAPSASAELTLQYKHGFKRVGNGFVLTAVLGF